jgi:hypothetical protein
MKHLHDDMYNHNNNTVEVLIGRLRKKSPLINVVGLKIKEVMAIILMLKVVLNIKYKKTVPPSSKVQLVYN